MYNNYDSCISLGEVTVIKYTVRNGVYIYTRDVVYKGVEAHIGCMMWFWGVK